MISSEPSNAKTQTSSQESPQPFVRAMIRSDSKSSKSSKNSSAMAGQISTPQSPLSETFSTQSSIKSPQSENGTAIDRDATLRPDSNMEMKTRRRIVSACITASMSTGRFLSKLGLARGEHATVRRLSRLGVGMGRSEKIEGIRYFKTTLGGVKVRIYLPETHQPLVNKPVCIYLHGGGWVISSARCYHRFTALFSRDTQTVVISVDYRLAPEHPFPCGLEDCLSVTRAVLNQNFDEKLFFPHSIDVSRVILAGDSAGGNLACATALDLIRDQDYRLFQLMLVCPALQCVTMSFPSYRQLGPTQPIGLEWFVPRYAGVKHVTKKLMDAIWRGTHLTPDDRVTLSRTVTLGSFCSASTPTSIMAPSISSASYFTQNGGGLDDQEDEEYVEYHEGDLNAQSPMTDDNSVAGKRFYFEDGESFEPLEETQTAESNSQTHNRSLSDCDPLNTTRNTSNDAGGSTKSPESTSTGGGGSSCAVSPTIGDYHDEELSPFVVQAVTELVKNKRAWPMLADDDELKYLPPTFIQACECDPLYSENQIFAERVRQAGALHVEISLLLKAGHIESLLAERLPSEPALKGYQEIVDFIIGCHSKTPASLGALGNGKPHIFDQVTDYF